MTSYNVCLLLFLYILPNILCLLLCSPQFLKCLFNPFQHLYCFADNQLVPSDRQHKCKSLVMDNRVLKVKSCLHSTQVHVSCDQYECLCSSRSKDKSIDHVWWQPFQVDSFKIDWWQILVGAFFILLLHLCLDK